MWWFALYLVLRSISCMALEQGSGPPQLIEVPVLPSHDAISHLEERAGVDVWAAIDGKSQMVVEPENFEEVVRTLKHHNLNYKVLVEDLLQMIQAEEDHMGERRMRAKRAVEQMDWSSYHKLEDIEGYLGWLNATQNSLVKVIPVASTFEGRPVFVAKVSDPQFRGPKKKIWIEGGIHAREWISPAVTTFLLHQVVSSAEFRPLLKKTEWYFVPVSNPDGYSYSFKGGRARMWRKNRKETNRFLPNRCKGVDLNRNWPLKWGVGASSNPCSSTYKGPNPFSEPETEGIRRIMETEGPFDLFITFHSYGQSVLYPWGWTTEPPEDVENLHQMGRRYAEAVKHASRGKIIYELGGSADRYGLASGASDDWAYGVLRTPYSYTIELRDNGFYGFLLPENQIMETVKESAVGVYCMVSYLIGVGVCGQPAGEARTSHYQPETHSSEIIFED